MHGRHHADSGVFGLSKKHDYDAKHVDDFPSSADAKALMQTRNRLTAAAPQGHAQICVKATHQHKVDPHTTRLQEQAGFQGAQPDMSNLHVARDSSH